MTWSALFGVFLLSHLVGDFLLQTKWQANRKQHGLSGEPEALRALAMHGLVYTLAFLPSLVWVAAESGLPTAAGAAALILVPHVVIDDGRLVALWVRRVKHVEGTPTAVVRLGVDQTLHALTLAGVALLAAG